MFTLRCTAKLLRRMPVQVAEAEARPTTALGDWYANLLNVGRLRLVLLTSEDSLLSVIVPAKGLPSLVPRFTAALIELLASGGADQPLIEAEIRQMAGVQFGRTRSRRVLGSMNDMALTARFHLRVHPDATLLDVEHRLGIMPCGPLGMRSPAEVAALRLLECHAKWG